MHVHTRFRSEGLIGAARNFKLTSFAPTFPSLSTVSSLIVSRGTSYKKVHTGKKK